MKPIIGGWAFVISGCGAFGTAEPPPISTDPATRNTLAYCARVVQDVADDGRTDAIVDEQYNDHRERIGLVTFDGGQIVRTDTVEFTDQLRIERWSRDDAQAEAEYLLVNDVPLQVTEIGEGGVAYQLLTTQTDGAGNPVEQRETIGNEVTLRTQAFDEARRRIELVEDLGEDGVIDAVTRWGFEEDREFVEYDLDGDAVVDLLDEMLFDEDGRPEVGRFLFEGRSAIQTYQYDDVGRLLVRRTRVPGGDTHVQQFWYDPWDRVVQTLEGWRLALPTRTTWDYRACR